MRRRSSFGSRRTRAVRSSATAAKRSPAGRTWATVTFAPVLAARRAALRSARREAAEKSTATRTRSLLGMGPSFAGPRREVTLPSEGGLCRLLARALRRLADRQKGLDHRPVDVRRAASRGAAFGRPGSHVADRDDPDQAAADVDDRETANPA